MARGPGTRTAPVGLVAVLALLLPLLLLLLLMAPPSARGTSVLRMELPEQPSAGAIPLPRGAWGLSGVDTADKNSGQGSGEGQAGSRGYVSYMPIAPHKGLHLASAASAIRAVNATAAMAVEQAASQSAFTSSVEVTQALGQQLSYHGGKVFSAPSTLTVYLLYYGAWSPRQKGIVETFVRSLDVGTAGGYKSFATVAGWWAINHKFYTDGAGKPITTRVKLGGTYSDAGSMGPRGTSSAPLSHADLESIIRAAVAPGNPKKLPMDQSGAYVLVTSADVYVSDFCSSVCAFHSSAAFFGQKLAYAFVGNPEQQCPLFCSYRYFDPMYASANGDLGADAVADKVGHELAELATNTLHGPQDRAGWCVGASNVENADLCEWEYGPVTFEGDNSVWNVRGLNSTRFLLQMNFDRVRQKCVLQHNSP